MGNQTNIHIEPSEIVEDPKALPHLELLNTLDNILNLQTVLYRLMVVLGNEPLVAVTYTHAVLTRYSNEIIQVFASRNRQNIRKAVQNWENEGGKIEYASV